MIDRTVDYESIGVQRRPIQEAIERCDGFERTQPFWGIGVLTDIVDSDSLRMVWGPLVVKGEFWPRCFRTKKECQKFIRQQFGIQRKFSKLVPIYCDIVRREDTVNRSF